MPPRTRTRTLGLLAAASIAWSAPVVAQDEATTRHQVAGMVIEVHPTREQMTVSHEDIEGVMPAMTMPFEVRDSKELDGVHPGARITFTLVMGPDSSHAEGVRVLQYRTAEQDPFTANRLSVLSEMVTGQARGGIAVGTAVPDFRLIDHTRRVVRLSDLRGRVVAVNFIYTSCTQPQFCFRVANQFGAQQRRFSTELEDDLVFLTITFDPVRDTPEVLAAYARTALRAATDGWRFLTGDPAEVRRVCDTFGVDYFLDEGFMNHTSRTAVIDRQGVLVANIEGNQFTSRQLGDLLQSVLRR
ncbi:MAG: SCO family protein [Acidobacteria bacterium]|nr:SCO family protein [Acidobacteriota bacterium]